LETIPLQTGVREEMVRLDGRVAEILRAKGWRDGLLLLFCPHTTAALTVNEAADPDVARDLVAFLRRRVPRDDGFAHAEGNSDAHVKAMLIGPDLTLMVEDGRLLLGTWQGVYFVEGDGPRQREVWVKFLPAPAGAVRE
jgi:secondary thiamine-phosphate synthase enzyme